MEKWKQRHAAAVAGLLIAPLGWLVFALAPVASQARDKEVEKIYRPGDFAHGRSIEAKRPGALQTLLLPFDVYRGSAEARLADLRVFDAHGQAVPHTIRGLAAPEPQRELSEPLVLFDLPHGAAAAARRSAKQGTGGEEGFWGREESLRIDARITRDVATLRLESGGPYAETEGANTGYLVDTGEPRRAMVGLELELAGSEETFVVPLRVRGSDDLVRFRKLAGRATVARLERAGHRLELNRVDFAPSRHRYLEITWPEGNMPVEVLSVRGRLAPRAEAPRRIRAKVKGTPVEDEAHSYLFDLGGTPPVDQMQLELARSDDLVEARLHSGASPDGPWYPLFAGLIFDLDYGGSRFRNDPMPTRAARHRYYKLEVSPKGGGVGDRAPTLEVAWRPEQLIYIARGDAPFTLSYGRAGVDESGFDFSDLLAMTQSRDRELPVESAVVGPERAFAEPDVLEAPGQGLQPRTVALWGTLILAVALVAAMSLRLLREMKR